MDNKKELVYFRQIIEYLLENDIVSTKNLSNDIGLSEKTVRKRVERVDQYIKANQLGEIVKKPRIGIWLKATEQQKVTLRNQISNMLDVQTIHTNRLQEIIRQILKYDSSGITTIKLANELYVSIPTILKTLVGVEKWFSEYNLYLTRIRNKGIKLGGNENNFRIALKDFVAYEETHKTVEQSIEYFMPGIDVKLVKKLIIQTEVEWGIKFTDVVFNELLIYSCLAIYRYYASDRKIEIPHKEMTYLERHSEYAFGQGIFSKIEEQFNIQISIQEKAFLSLQILCSKVIDNVNQIEIYNNVEEYDQKLELFVGKIIDIIGNILNFDFSGDNILFQGLLLHIRPMIFRLRYGRKHKDTLVDVIKSEYKQVYRALWSISVLFEVYYNLQITEDELSYIVLYFQAAIERKENPIRVILVSHLGVGHNQLLREKIRKSYPDIKECEIVAMHKFNIMYYKYADIIISTERLPIEDDRLIEIENFLTDQGVQKLNHRMMKVSLKKKKKEIRFDSKCHQLFEPDLILVGLDYTDKKEVIQFLTDKLMEKGYVTKKYFSSVLEREDATLTSIGNQVAIPHGNQNEINEAKVVIATLKKPIKWNAQDLVDVVFLLAVKMTTNEEIEKSKLFYKQYIKLIETDSKVDFLRNMKSGINLYKYLIH